MKDSNNLPKDLPSMEHEFNIECKGEVTGKPFTGNFTYRIPNLKSKALADKKRAELDGGFSTSLDAGVQQLHYMVAYLRYSLIVTPKWWEDSDYGYALYDYNVIRTVFEQAEKFEAKWMEQVWGVKSDSGNQDKA